MPRRHRADASSRVTALPSSSTSPVLGDKSPEMTENREDLPAPLGPTIPTASPAWTARESDSATTTRPNRLETRSSSSSGAAGVTRWSV